MSLEIDGNVPSRLTFDVLMTGLPTVHLQQRLDLAHRLHPES